VNGIYFDGFGRGQSARATTAKEYSFDRDVEDIEGLRKALRLDQINVLGHSYGGMVAQAYALRYPNSVKRLILSNTLFSAEMWQAGVNNFNQIIQDQCPEVWTKLQQLRAEGFHSSAREYQEANYSVPLGLFYFFDSSNIRKIAADPAPFNPDVFYTIAGDDAFFLVGGDVAKLDFRSQLKSLKMPVLILTGRFDRFVLPRYSLQFKRYAPQAEFVMFENAGHFPFIEEPARTFEVVKRFLEK
jgi:proline iminopeptidase